MTGGLLARAIAPAPPRVVADNAGGRFSVEGIDEVYQLLGHSQALAIQDEELDARAIVEWLDAYPQL